MFGERASPLPPDSAIPSPREPAAPSLSRWAAGSLIILFVVLGLVGHDPWKADEAYAFGIVYSMLTGGDWVVPMLSGEAFVEKPPLVYWLAALTAQLASPVLPLHDGARLASGVLSAIAIGVTALCARAIFGRDGGHGRVAALLLASSLGFVLHARMLLTDLGVVAGVALALYGLVRIPHERRVWLPAALLGTGCGIAFLSKGLVGIAAVGATTMLLPLLSRGWRSRRYAWTLGAAFLFALPWLAIWPLALFAHSPAYFYDWFWLNNIGRFVGFGVQTLGAAHEPGFLWDTMPWFTFPVLPLAVWAWVRGALRWRDMPRVQVAFTFAAVYVSMIALSSSARVNYLLPLLPALAMVAPAAIAVLPRWLAAAAGAVSLVFFVGAALVVWLVWALAVHAGSPPDWPFLVRHLPREYTFVFSAPLLALALALTFALLHFAFAQWRSRMFALSAWSGGMMLFGVAVTLLWMPWIDAAKSYRQPFTAMRQHLPLNANCLSFHRVGESERAVLHYVMHAPPQRYHAGAAATCPFVLVQGLQAEAGVIDEVPHRRVLWSGARPGDAREKFWLLELPREASADDRVAATTHTDRQPK
jgi:4-amino-4-deoxy-L-arabinose transferase-like glycosyltransferase